MDARDRAVEPIELLVAGGGMAGVFAALAAAEAGCAVLLVEPHNVLGGQGTAGGVAGFCGDTQRVNRLFTELLARLEALHALAPYDPNHDRRPYELEALAFALQEMAAARGVRVLLHARAVDADAAEGRVTRVRVAALDGPRDYTPGFVVDATGECLLARAAGFPILHEGPLRQLPMSLYFTLWDTGRAVEPVLPAGCPEWPDDDALPMTTVHRFDSGKAEVKMKVVGYDAADAESYAAAEMEARRTMMGLVYHLQTRGYAGVVYDRYQLAGVSRRLGVREGRRILGEHLLTVDEVRQGAVFPDAVAVGTYHLDYHWPETARRAGTGITTMVEPYQIPLRALIPRGAANLLVPGRGASGDQQAMSSFRVMATCAQLGVAAGVAAARSLRAGVPPGQLDPAALAGALAAGGQSLDLSDYGDYLRRFRLVRESIIGDERPFPQCHASTLVQLPNNRFLAAWFGGTHERHPDVGIWGAERFAGRWSPPRLLAKVDGRAHWNPVLFRAPGGALYLFFKVGESIDAWETWVMRSGNDGRSWDAPRELVPGDRGGRGPVRNRPLVTAGGAWLAPSSLERKGRPWTAFIDRSEDGGVSWQAGEELTLDPALAGAGVIQPALWESAPGRVHMLLRSNCGYICRSDSDDGGRSWSPVHPTPLPNNNSGIDVARLPDGTLALAFNPIGGDFAARTPLSLALSSDNGANWPHRLDLETAAGEYSYPSIIPTAVGMAVTYTWNRQRIAFWHGSVEMVQEGNAHVGH